MSDQRGMSLVELVVAMSIGVVILLAAFTVIDRGFQIQKETVDREDAAQRGRLAMDRMIRGLRSQVAVCPAKSAITAASPNSVTFTVDTSGGVAPKRRILTFDPTAKTLTEASYNTTGTTSPFSFVATPTQTGTLLNNVVADGTTPFFTYYKDDGTGVGSNTAFTPVTADDLAAIAMVGIAFANRPNAKTATDNKRAVTYNDSVFIRNADPLKREPNPACE